MNIKNRRQFDKAAEYAVTHGRLSMNVMQGYLEIPYVEAERVMGELEEMGVTKPGREAGHQKACIKTRIELRRLMTAKGVS